jgi:hypothetical protein
MWQNTTTATELALEVGRLRDILQRYEVLPQDPTGRKLPVSLSPAVEELKQYVNMLACVFISLSFASLAISSQLKSHEEEWMIQMEKNGARRYLSAEQIAGDLVDIRNKVRVALDHFQVGVDPKVVCMVVDILPMFTRQRLSFPS